MNATPVAEFASWIGGEAVGFEPAAVISRFALDSNSVQPGDLFLAIKGARVDGHDFAKQALSAGAIGVLAERPLTVPHIIVENLVEALAALARHFRAQFNGPVVAISGSAGKTSTKEFVAAALLAFGPVLKTPGNWNSEYTSPLLWTDLEPEHRAVVVEMAMRGYDQIAHLASFSKPTIGLITNIGYAHMEMVGSRKGIARAKGELLQALPDDGVAILWHEDDMLKMLREMSPRHSQTFGFGEGADSRITAYHVESWRSAVCAGVCHDRVWEARLPVAGRHMALNAAAAVLTAAVLGVEPAVAGRGVEAATLPPMRMEVVEREGATILLDNYNASPPSMIAAIETLSELPVGGRRFAVIGEMRELGAYTANAHRSVGRALGASGVDRVLFYGPSTSLAASEAIASGLPSTAISMATSIEDVEVFLAELAPGDAALIKGSRALELERALHLEGHS